MKMTLDAWGRSVDGQLIDRDGSAGAQCWDLWADYAERAVGVPIGWTYTVNRPSHPDHYLASSMWLFFPTPRVGDLAKYFVRLGRDAVAQAGDVAVWARSSAYLASHIAVATGPAVGGMLPCWTQNPGATKHAWLTTAGLLGYLRPIALMGTPPTITTESEEDDDMPDSMFATVDGVPSWCWMNWANGAVFAVHTQKEADWIGRYMGSVRTNFSTDPLQSDLYKNKLALLGILNPNPIVRALNKDAEARLRKLVQAGTTAALSGAGKA